MNAVLGPRLIVLAHEPLAQALHQIAGHAFPECALALEWIDIGPQCSLEAAQAKLREHLDAQAPRSTLVLVDVAGATPANALQNLLAGRDWLRGVSGLNVAMLWRVLCYRQEDLALLAERALSGGQRGIIELSAPG